MNRPLQSCIGAIVFALVVTFFACLATCTAEDGGALFAGKVFLDDNVNGQLDPGEKGIPGVQVTDGIRIVVSDLSGDYSLPASDALFVYISRPSDYQATRWYFPAGGHDFALTPSHSGDTFTFAHITDCHAFETGPEFIKWSIPRWLPDRTPDGVTAWLLRYHVTRMTDLKILSPEVVRAFRNALSPLRDTSELKGNEVVVEYVREFQKPGSPLSDVPSKLAGLVREIAVQNPSFILSTGDLILEGNLATPQVARGWYEVYDSAMTRARVPVFHTIGNNDIVGSDNSDIKPEDPGYGKGIFLERYGPSHYSFNYGAWHFAVLDSHERRRRRKWDFYDIDEVQRRWLERDLSLNANKLIALVNHEPFFPSKEDYKFIDLDDLMGKYRVRLTLSGHDHHNAIATRDGTTLIITAAVSGGRWMVPEMDQAPRGYRIVSVEGATVASVFKRTGRDCLEVLNPDVEGAEAFPVYVDASQGEGPSRRSTLMVAAAASEVKVSRVRYRLDDEDWLDMVHGEGIVWYSPSDIEALSPGTHTLQVESVDEAGTKRRISRRIRK